MAVVIERFTQNNPADINKLNANFAALVGAINALVGDSLLELSPAPGNDGGVYLPIAGGTLLGQLQAPSILVGPNGGNKYEVITTDDTATAAKEGIVLAAANVAQLAQAVSNPPTQAEVQALSDKVDELLAALVASGEMAGP